MKDSNREITGNKLLATEEWEHSRLEERVRENLRTRLKPANDYSEEEIEKVSKLNHRLFPMGVEADEETTERLRALAKLSQCELKRSADISSHRKYIGPFIVLAKKLTWPFIHAHLKDTAAAQEEFNSLAVEAIAKQVVETEKAKR